MEHFARALTRVPMQPIAFKALVRLYRTAGQFRELVELLTGDVEAPWAAGAMSREQACRLEHTLFDGLDDKICTLLGHPRFCPHGRPIYLEVGRDALERHAHRAPARRTQPRDELAGLRRGLGARIDRDGLAQRAGDD